MNLQRPTTAGLYSDPEIVSLSGWEVTDRDIQLFDDKWMTQDFHYAFLGYVHNAFWLAYDPFGVALGSVVWMIGERMSAMVRMYELTRAVRYLDELRDLVNLVLAGRDDHIDLQPEPAPQHNPAFRPDPASRVDGIRGNRVMPAWGYRSVGAGGYHHSSLVVAGVYAYPIAAFARIVAEDPTLHGQPTLRAAARVAPRGAAGLAMENYGADAKAATTALLEMLEAFLPELHDPNLTPGGENYFANPLGNQLLTYERCSQGYSTAWQTLTAALNSTHDLASIGLGDDDASTIQDEYQKCYTVFHDIAGFPLAHNEYQSFVMVLIELSRALDTELFKADLSAADRQHAEEVARHTIPAIVAGAQRYYRNRFWVDSGPHGEHFLWNYLDDNPDSISHDWDNTNHANLEMNYIGLLWRNKDRLNALLTSSPAGPDKIMLSSTDTVMLANTFLDVVVQESLDANGLVHTHLADNFYRTPAKPIDARDAAVDGWLNLAEFNSLVYQYCETLTLAPWDSSIDDRANYAPQPHLGMANHAALLAMKKYRATDHRHAPSTGPGAGNP